MTDQPQPGYTWVCAECLRPLERREMPEDDQAAERIEWVCPEHGLRAFTMERR